MAITRERERERSSKCCYKVDKLKFFCITVEDNWVAPQKFIIEYHADPVTSSLLTKGTKSRDSDICTPMLQQHCLQQTKGFPNPLQLTD